MLWFMCVFVPPELFGVSPLVSRSNWAVKSKVLGVAAVTLLVAVLVSKLSTMWGPGNIQEQAALSIFSDYESTSSSCMICHPE